MKLESLSASLLASVKKILPNRIFILLRKIFTAILMPLFFGYQSGHFFSSLFSKSLDSRLKPLPWYTYPCIDYLSKLDLSGLDVLEFGGGQSSLWWSERADYIRVFDESQKWADYIKKSDPRVNITVVENNSEDVMFAQVEGFLNRENKKYDVIVIDGFLRDRLANLSKKFLNTDGMIILDNSQGYGLYEVFSKTEFCKVDFYGYAPGVIKKSCTSIIFFPNSRFFSSKIRI